MKIIFFMLIIIISVNSGFAQHSTFSRSGNQKLRVGILIYPGAELLDFAGPTDVFVKAGNLTDGQYEIITIGLKPGNIPTENGTVLIRPEAVLDTVNNLDIFVIPGAKVETLDALIAQQHPMEQIKKQVQQTPFVMSVCTGSYLLGAMQLLNGRRATTHWFVADEFGERFPETDLIKNVRYVDDGDLVTASGITSGIDGALHVVERYSGKRIAGLVTKALQYDRAVRSDWPVK